MTTPPVNKTVCEGQNVTFSATATAAIVATTPVTTASTTNLSYQWQLSTNNGFTYSDISGQSGSVTSGTAVLTLSSVTVDMSGYRYRIKFSNEANICGITSTVTLTVNATNNNNPVFNSCGVVGSVVLKATVSRHNQLVCCCNWRSSFEPEAVQPCIICNNSIGWTQRVIVVLQVLECKLSQLVLVLSK
jgi:hypothetical protein